VFVTNIDNHVGLVERCVAPVDRCFGSVADHFELLNNRLGQIETHLRDVDLHLNHYNDCFDYSDNLIYAITFRMDIRYVEYCSFFCY